MANAASIPTFRPSRPLFDPGWLFIISGVALLAAAVLIPAGNEVQEARFHRDQALKVEAHRATRLSRYEEYIGAVDSRQPQVLLSLAESQLNQIPTDRGALSIGKHKNELGGADASVFPALEPPPVVLEKYTPTVSRLESLVTSSATRRWVLITGLVSVLVGLVIGIDSRASMTPRRA